MWQPKVIMQDGVLMPFADARVHPLSPGFAYGAAVFEGIRAYRDPASGRLALFRLQEHLDRLAFGMKIMRFDRIFEEGYLRDRIIEVIRGNEPDDDVYVRVLVYVATVSPMTSATPVSFTVAALPREKPKYAEGMHLGVSSWHRISDNASPPRVKSTANYHSSRLTILQARADGYDGALLLTRNGKVSETPIACVFFVRDGKLITPSPSSDILESVTRDTIMRLHEDMTGTPVIEREIDRTEIYLAEEAFVCGTGQEVIPVVSFDRLPVGDGKVGPVTTRLRQRYFDVVRGKTTDYDAWRTQVN